MFTPWHETRKTNFGMREQKKIEHPGTKSTQRCAICAIIQSNLYKQRFGLLRSSTDVAPVSVIFYGRFAASGGTKEKLRLDANIEDNPRSRRAAIRCDAMRSVASVRQFANSRRVFDENLRRARDISL